MITLREAAEKALEYLDAPSEKLWPAGTQDRIITALKAALAEPVQEPVAWMDREGDIYKMPEIEGWAPPHTMLYTAPPQRKPLTEDEIALIVADCSASAHRHDDISFARAIERAHGIGGQDEP